MIIFFMCVVIVVCAFRLGVMYCEESEKKEKKRGNVFPIKDKFEPGSVEEAIENFRRQQEKFEAVILLAVKPDGTQTLMTSKISGQNAAWLLQFANSYYLRSHQINN